MAVRAVVHRMIDELDDADVVGVLQWMVERGFGNGDRNVTPAPSLGHECRCGGACNR